MLGICFVVFTMNSDKFDAGVFEICVVFLSRYSSIVKQELSVRAFFNGEFLIRKMICLKLVAFYDIKVVCGMENAKV